MRHADAISAAFENEVMVQEAIREELAELRKKEATIQMLQSGLIIVTGAVAIIATAGAATPIVIGGFAAGSFTMAYGVSNFEEAKNSYLLGSAGDPYTSAFNPIRDTVFCGNQLAYDIFGQVSMTASALVVPVGRALHAGTSIPRAFAVHLGKTAIAGGTTYGVNKIGEHLGLSDNARFWAGVGAGALAGIVTQKIDKAYNLSGFHLPSHPKLEISEDRLADVETKPNQQHHFATNKNSKYTSQFEKIAEKYGLDLNDEWNKDFMPHQGRHPNAYHDWMLAEMQSIDRMANGNKAVFLKLFERVKQTVIENPDMLRKEFWG